MLQRQGDLNAALQAFRNSMTIGQKLAAADPNNADWQRDLSVSHNKIGDVLQRQGDLNAALQAFRNSMTIRQKLAAADPNNAEWQRDLSISHDRIGDVLQRQGDLNAALPGLSQQPDHPRDAGRAPIRITPNGSAISRSAMNASATCCQTTGRSQRRSTGLPQQHDHRPETRRRRSK